MELHQRKPNRLPYFDYSAPGAYFITICTKDRKSIFWEGVGASIARPQKPALSWCGRIVDATIRSIPAHYPAITVDHYAVMPNHIHLLLQINADLDGRPMVTLRSPASYSNSKVQLQNKLVILSGKNCFTTM